MNLEQLRKQAKELVKSARAGEQSALERMGGRPTILANAQLVLARELGYRSWPALVAAAEASVEAFVAAATSGRKTRAEELLRARPELERDTWARLVLGRGWDGDSNQRGGPRGWAPLLYVCHSVFASTDLARDLLGRGADPNAWSAEEWGRSTALYGAAGVVHDPELTRLLLEAGASPDDGESLYHSTETESPECLRLLLEYGAETRGTNALARALDFDRIDHVRLLLDAGADANEFPSLVHAVRRGRGPAFLRLLAERGAELDRPGGEVAPWLPDVPARTAYAQAVLRGRRDCADVLADLGASTELDPADAPIAAVARGERPVSVPDQLDLDQQEAVIMSAVGGRLDAVLETFGPHFRGIANNSPEGTLLHHAAWFAHAESVRKLLGLGADALARSNSDFATPLAWAVLSSFYRREPDPDYVTVAELLVEAGAELEPRFLDVAAGPLREWLESQGPGEL